MGTAAGAGVPSRFRSSGPQVSGALMADGAHSLSADANSRIDAAGFLECYWQGVRARVERRRGAGLPVPDGINLRPDVDID